ncbi:MAG: hypothetical protein WC059_00785 [Candidatus Paceibacterota bacterium]
METTWILRKMSNDSYRFETKNGSHKTTIFKYRISGYCQLNNLVNDGIISLSEWLTLLDQLFLCPIPNVSRSSEEKDGGLEVEIRFLLSVREEKEIAQQSIVIHNLPNLPCLLEGFFEEGAVNFYYIVDGEDEFDDDDHEEDELVDEEDNSPGPRFSPNLYSKADAHLWLTTYALFYAFDPVDTIRLHQEVEASSLPPVRYIEFKNFCIRKLPSN